MTRIFRSNSSTLDIATAPPPPPPPLSFSPPSPYEDADFDDDDDEGYLADFNSVDGDSDYFAAGTSPFISPETNSRTSCKAHHPQFSLLAVLAAALRKSLVTCSVEDDDVVSDVDIGWPTDVRHVSHVTFDRFNGFLGLPVELQPDVPRKPPSASTSVFGVSPQSMQCSYDHRGNSVPTILLRMQNRLYSEGGLQAEGIFRINAENSQEEDVRNQLNQGVVPHGIDVHCLSGLIKAWFRELPSGVLDALTPEQVVNCNTEEECTHLVTLLPPTEAALLDWAINLMADVAHHEDQNKMNARNIAMVFAPNMTQMADPLTALIHAVQVMNFLKTLILKTLREREESAATTLLRDHAISVENAWEAYTSNETEEVLTKQALDNKMAGAPDNRLVWSATMDGLEYENNESSSFSFRSKNDNGEMYGCISDRMSSSPVLCKRRTLAHSFEDAEYDDTDNRRILDRLSLRKGIWKLRRHAVFQLSKPVRKS